MKQATASGPYKVPKEHDGLRSLGMAVAMHAVLILFLWVGVHWQSNEPVAVEAEVWDMKVQQAAPPAPPAPEVEPEPAPAVKPPPAPVAPPDEVKPEPKAPDIALERLKAKRKADKEKQEALQKERIRQEELKLEKFKQEKAKLDKEKAEQKKKQEEQKARDEQEKKDKKEQADKKLKADKEAKAKQEKAAADARAAEMRRITGAVGAGTSGTAAKSTGPRSDGGYEAAIRGKIKGNLVYSGTDDTLTASFHISQLPTGEIISVRKNKGSGNAAYDTAVENAIWKSSPLPKKKDGTVVRDFDTDFNMKDLH